MECMNNGELLNSDGRAVELCGDTKNEMWSRGLQETDLGIIDLCV